MSTGRAAAREDGTSTAVLLRAWRERALQTQEELARRAGLNVRTVRRLEVGGAGRPHSSTLRLLATALGLSPDERTALVAAVDAGPRGDRPWAVPRQLPAAPPAFTGRTVELADLDGVDDATAVVVAAIDGMAGAGKTALAVHAAHGLAHRYPDGQLFLDLHGHTDGFPPVAPSAALERVLRALGVPAEQIPRHLDDRAALYRTRLAGRRMLVLLDDAATEAQVAPLLPGTPGCLVLVTSRRRLAGLHRTRSITLDVLPRADAVPLFARVAGEQRLAGEPPGSLAEVVELCGRLPLAIGIAAARLRSRPAWSLAHLAGLLADERLRLGELEAGERSVTAALDLSYRQLGAGLQRAYRLLGLHPGADLDRYAAAALTGTSPARAERLVEDLLEANLVQEVSPGRYRFHDLVRTHAAATAARVGADAEDGAGRAAIGRLLDHYCCAASRTMDVVEPDTRVHRPPLRPFGPSALPAPPDPAAARAWLDGELPNLLAAAQSAAEHGMAEHAVYLATTLHRHLRPRLGRSGDAEALHTRVLAAACAFGDRAGEAQVLVCLGQVRWMRGMGEAAAECFELALPLARAAGLRAVEVDALTGLAFIQVGEHRFEEARVLQTEAREIARRSGDRRGEMEALLGLGWVGLAEGRPAAEHLEAALSLAPDCGDETNVQRVLRALEHVDGEAAAAAGATGGRDAEVATLLSFAWVHRLHGRDDRAVDTYRHALTLARQAGDRHWQLEVQHAMGMLHLGAGRPARALACHRSVLELATALGHPLDEARAHDGLAHAHLAQGRRERAREHWRRALDTLTGLGAEVTTGEGATTVAALVARLRELEDAPERAG